MSDTEVGVSSTFTPDANLDASPPDYVLVSSDFCLFFVHRRRIAHASDNALRGLLCAPIDTESMPPSGLCDLQLPPLPETGDLVNLMLHAVYNLPVAHFHHSLDTLLIAAEQTLPAYGMSVSKFVTRGASLYQAILDISPLAPLPVYTFAAEHGIEELAVAVSPYMHGCSIDTLDNAVARRMGGTYANRLHQLHIRRLRSLKALLDKPPYPHVASPGCSSGQRRVVIKAWALAAAQIFFDATPGASLSYLCRNILGSLTVDVFIATTPGAIEAVLFGLITNVTCTNCKTMLHMAMREVVDGWLLTQGSNVLFTMWQTALIRGLYLAIDLSAHQKRLDLPGLVRQKSRLRFFRHMRWGTRRSFRHLARLLSFYHLLLSTR